MVQSTQDGEGGACYNRMSSYRKMDAKRTRVADTKRTREGLKTALEPPVLSSSVTASKSRAPVADEREVH